jgi:hypothetical protein
MRMQHLKRRHKKMHKSPILKNKRSPKKSAKKSKMRAVSQRLVVHRTLMSGVHRTLMSGVHRTVRCDTRQSAQRGHRQALSGCSTGLSGVHRTVRCATGRRQRSDPTVDCYRRQRSADMACTGHFTLDVRWCTGLSGAPDDRKLLLSVQRLVWGVEAINTTPTGHSPVSEPKQHTKSHSAYFQELKHPSA